MNMMGSGIYSQEAEVEFECNCDHETCLDGKGSEGCGHTWITSVVTDDWGNIDADENCPKCNHKATYVRSA